MTRQVVTEGGWDMETLVKAVRVNKCIISMLSCQPVGGTVQEWLVGKTLSNTE